MEIRYNLLTAPRTVSSTYAQVARAQSCADHVQHIERLSRATCSVHLVQRDSSASKFDRIGIAFILALSYWLKPLTDEGGQEIGVPGENP